MSVPVIHFSTLSELLDDFNYNPAPVRVAISERSETREGSHYPTRVTTVAVHVTAYTAGCILSYVPFMQNIHLNAMTQHETPSPKEKYESAWADAKRIADEVREAIKAAGHEPRSGRIDLGDVAPVQGKEWK